MRYLAIDMTQKSEEHHFTYINERINKMRKEKKKKKGNNFKKKNIEAINSVSLLQSDNVSD